MLQAAPSLTVAQDNLTVFFGYNPRAIVAMLARLVRAFNPFGVLPPATASLSKVVTTRITQETLAQLNNSLALVGTRFGNLEQRTQPLVQFNEAITTMASWFSVGAITTPPRDYLFDPRIGNEPAGAATSTPSQPHEPKAALSRLADFNGEGGWLREPEDQKATSNDVTDLAFITLWASYEKLLASSYLTGPIDVPMGAPRDIWPLVERVNRITALVLVLHNSITAARLREQAAVITSPAFAPLLDYMGPNSKEQATGYASRLLALKVHPWIAEAERLRVPTRRYTEWGAASHTMGLSRGPEGMWSNLMRYGRARNGREPQGLDIRGIVLGEGDLLDSFLKESRDFFMLRDMIKGDDVTQCEALLALTSPGAPPQVHLHGQMWKALPMTGAMASEAIPDLLSLMLRPRFPLLDKEGSSDLAGNADAFHYNAAFWVTGKNSKTAIKPLLSRPTNVPPLYVQQHRTEYQAGYALRQLVPPMIRPVMDGEYFGDEDAIFAPYTPEGVAKLLGFSSATAMLNSEPTVAKLSHLLVNTGATGWQKLDGREEVTRVFHSTRTRQPWRIAVEVPANVMPYEVLAMDQRTAPIIHDVEAVIVRTPELPVMTASTLPLADGAAQMAVKMLGATV